MGEYLKAINCSSLKPTSDEAAERRGIEYSKLNIRLFIHQLELALALLDKLKSRTLRGQAKILKMRSRSGGTS